MCQICNCLVWSLDVVQRAITFFLLGMLICVVCVGFCISIIAGIAYGYNYSLAEFLTFTRSDVTVYMRRGQMNDRPDLAQFGSRRFGNDLDTNFSTDYQENIADTGGKKPLAETLGKADDTRKYAERLSKFTKSESSDVPGSEEEVPEGSVSYYRFTTPPVQKISIHPNPAMQTTVLESGSSSIIMRKFSPIKDIAVDYARKDPDEYFYKVGDIDEKDKIKSKMKINKDISDEKPEEDEREYATRRFVPMRQFEGGPELEEDGIAYKPV
ncbi:PREDICTED: uncharacterized protein LOC106108506 [Papilio polytes]|uniref:uncharacterized protein LOC106108506 n=1 Tax=Papilio polytes TaxID=76194 RepID=UPI00067666F5|nr:PREDICTED: uncharacterized protein LOC106108506 [Papilio polytes]